MHDYVAGKTDWLAWGLPYEGDADLVGRHVDADVRRCTVDEAEASPPTEYCVVVNEHGVVQGVAREGTVSVGVSTVRPSEEVHALEHRMHERNVRQVVVTRSDGFLLGVYRRSDV